MTPPVYTGPMRRSAAVAPASPTSPSPAPAAATGRAQHAPLPPRLLRSLLLLLLALPGLRAQAPAADTAPGAPAAPAPAPVAQPAADATATWSARTAGHVEAARERTLSECAQRGIALPADFLAWVDADPIRRTTVYGCRREPLPVLLALRSLDLDLGPTTVRERHPQLALAFAIESSFRQERPAASPWNDGDEAPATGLPHVGPRPQLQLAIGGDPRQRIDTNATDRPLDRDDHIVNFLESHAPIEVEVETRELPPLEYDERGVAKPRGAAVAVTRKVARGLYAADVIASASLQREFNAYMAAHGHPEVAIDCGDGVVHWRSTAAVGDEALRGRIAAAHELFQAAYRSKGRMPRERDRAPTFAESMAWFVRNDAHPFPPETKAARQWPRFPLTAPWPVLMMLVGDDQPLREREDIWARFRDDGEMRTYGEYIGDIAQQFDMQSARRSSPLAFAYGSIQMMWKDGGVCGTMGNIGARTYRICGIPSSTAGQPGHCAVVKMTHDPKTGRYTCVGDQYASGGDEVTAVHAQWRFDDDGGRKPMAIHQSIAAAVNHGLRGFVDALAMRRAFDALPAEQRRAEALAFAEAALASNPFAVAAVEGAIAALDAPAALVQLGDLVGRTLDALPDAKAHTLLRSTLLGLVHARIGALPAPADRGEVETLLAALDAQDCQDAGLLARCWRTLGGEDGFAAHCVALVAAHADRPAKERSKRAGEELKRRLQALARTVRGAEQKRAWAQKLLAAFAGKESYKTRKGEAVDPAAAWLRQQAEPRKDGKAGT
jgi:hypothetical protein